MPKILTLSNVGAGGINSDLQPWELGPNAITDGRNIKIQSGAVASHCGYTSWTVGGGGANFGVLQYMDMPGGARAWVRFGRTSIYEYTGSVHNNRTPATAPALGAGGEFSWSASLLGSIMVASNPAYYPIYWKSGMATFLDLPWDATHTWRVKGNLCASMRSCKGFLFAMNLTEGGVNYADSYRWSTLADANGLPSTWDETDLSAIAGKAALGGASGYLIDGRSLRDSFVLYSQHSINVLDYVGGTFIWQRRLLTNSMGAVSINTIVEANEQIYSLWIDDFVVIDGNSVRSIAYNKIKQHLTANLNLNAIGVAFAVRHPTLKEVWFCVPTGSSVLPDTAYIYNWIDGTWVIKTMPAGVGYAAYGNTSSSTEDIVGVMNSDGSLVWLETPGANATAYVERQRLPIGDQVGRKTITRVYPHISGSNPVTIEIGSHNSAGEPVVWQTGQTFDPDTQRKVDVRSSGQLAAWRVTSISGLPFTISGMDIEYEEAGAR